MKNTLDSHRVADKTVDRIENMETVRLGKTIQVGMELWKIIDRIKARERCIPSELKFPNNLET